MSMQCAGQISIFDILKEQKMPDPLPKDPHIGEYVHEWGRTIDHCMLPAHIGYKVIVDVSTRSHTWMICGILKRYFDVGHERFINGASESDVHQMRAIVDVGRGHMLLIDSPMCYTHIYETYRSKMEWSRRFITATGAVRK